MFIENWVSMLTLMKAGFTVIENAPNPGLFSPFSGNHWKLE